MITVCMEKVEDIRTGETMYCDISLELRIRMFEYLFVVSDDLKNIC